jgi:hypothetical protein
MAIPFITVDLDKPRKMRLTMRGMIEFEQITGKKIADLGETENIETYLKLFWIMLKNEDPELTFDHTLDLIDEYTGGIEELMTVISEAALASAGTVGKPKKAGNPKA